MPPRFIVDHNVGRLARWLRMMGYDALTFTGPDDGDMVKTALAEDRVILTRDTQIGLRRVATSGRLRVILLRSDNPEEQLRQVVQELGLDYSFKPFSMCLECNVPLHHRSREEMRRQVPAYVHASQEHFMQCPQCHRIYWRGTHWRAMERRLERLRAGMTKH